MKLPLSKREPLVRLSFMGSLLYFSTPLLSLNSMKDIDAELTPYSNVRKRMLECASLERVAGINR